MSIILRQAFLYRGQANIYTVLENTRKTMEQEIKRHQSKAKLDELAKGLTELYYPRSGKVSPGSEIDKYQQFLMEETGKTLASVVDSFDFNDLSQSPYKTKGLTTRETTMEKYLQRFNFQYKALKKEIKRIKKVNSVAKMEQVAANMQRLAKEVEQFMVSNQALMANRVYYPKNEVGKRAAQLIREMALYSAAINQGKNLNVSEIGKRFEDSLVEAFDRYFKDQSNKLVKRVGDELVPRGVWAGKNLGDISYNIELKGLDLNGLKDNNIGLGGFTITEKNATFKYSPGQDKMGKMDVIVQYPNGNLEDLRFSAKSWTHGSRSAGETSIAAGLTRAVGPNIMEYYALAMLNPRLDARPHLGEGADWIAYEAGHKLAKLALASDIVMGLSQRGDKLGRADILVIDTGVDIVVKDISQLVQAVDNIAKYNETNIQNQAANVYKAMNGVMYNRSQTYYGLYISTLNKMKVSYMLNQDLTK